jgi:GT2 family glycosyltransferase
MKGYTAVIPHYFKDRERSLELAVSALINQTKSPYEVIVWNNDAKLLSLDAVRVINAPMNLGPGARFWAGLAAATDYVWFQDNDVMVAPEVLKHVIDWAETFTQSVISLHGYIIPPGTPYADRKYAVAVTKPTEVNVTLGRGELVPMSILRSVMEELNGEAFHQMDDLWFSSMLRSLGYRIMVVPGLLHNLDGWNRGASSEAGHYANRARVFAELFPKEVKLA